MVLFSMVTLFCIILLGRAFIKLKMKGLPASSSNTEAAEAPRY